MEAPEAERRVQEFSALVKCQRRLIGQLEKDGSDVTSARIIFDSLRVSLALCIHNRHRARCAIEAEQSEKAPAAPAPATVAAANREPAQPRILARKSGSARERKPVFDIVPKVALRGGDIPMAIKNGFRKFRGSRGIDAILKERHEKPAVPGDGIRTETGDQSGQYVFRPLTEEEKFEFMNSLDVKSKTLLAELLNDADSPGSAVPLPKSSIRKIFG
jgi:hypothetical protein